VRRFLTTQRHVAGLVFGGLVAAARQRRESRVGRGLGAVLQAVLALLVRPFLDRDLIDLPFPAQLRRRLERLGPTYIKLGQILSLRRDILPASITEELLGLLDDLPAAPFDKIEAIIAADLGRPVEELFSQIEPIPVGSASIAQAHRATTTAGEEVILKVVKPGIRETLMTDIDLLRLFAILLHPLLSKFRPRQLVKEFAEFARREVEMECEADNAEIFAANFSDRDDIVFPRIYRHLSGRDVLCMEYLRGVRPDSDEARRLPEEERGQVVELGVTSILRMLYQDGFFHADLHPGNLLVLPGARLAYLDLGMVGRLSLTLRRKLLFYYYCVMEEDFENAARYLAAVAEAGPGADPHEFRREVAELCRRWRNAVTMEEFSLAYLVLACIAQGVHYQMYFPVEMVMMAKALVTYEGVGYALDPSCNVLELSKRHVSRIFEQQLSPLRLVREGLRSAPDIAEALAQLPMLVTEGLRLLESHTHRPPESPLAGLRATLFGGFCLVAGAILAAVDGPPIVWTLLLALGLLVPLRRGR